ncbi:MAG: Rv3235 family protein [Protaetiibacter sp.]
MAARERPAIEGNTARSVTAHRPDEELFGRQPATTRELPDPRPLLENLTRCVIEIMAGARDLEQIARWVDDAVYTTLLKRVVLSAQARQAARRPAVRPMFTLGSVTISEPRDGVVEAVVVVRGRARTRAVAIRLEGLDRRWRATAIHVL